MKALYFVRHGQSEDNRDYIWSRPETVLTPEGRNQAMQAAANIKQRDLTFDLIVVSPLPRTLETARIIADAIGYPIDAIESDQQFVERDWGNLTGVPNKNFYSGNRTIADIDNAEGSEKLEALQKRAAQALSYLKHKPQDNILLVGHGTFGRCLRRVINGEPYTNEYLPDLVRYKNAEVARLI